jgi:protocatechuate 3,4-dioxygenase alpha subunit
MLESWQADAAGLYPGQDGADPNVTGFCRFAADGETGELHAAHRRPGRVGLRDGRDSGASHLALDRGAGHQHRPSDPDLLRG